MYLFWFAINTIQAIFTALWTCGWITIALLSLLVTGKSHLAHKLAKHVWAPGLLWGARAKVTVHGLNHIQPSTTYLFAANHQSIIDIPALMVALPMPLHFVVKQELGRIPFLGWYIRAMGMVLITRSRHKEAARKLDRADQAMREGRSFVCFPEGTRSRTGSLGPFKHGAFQPAINAQVPIAPIAIKGSLQVLPSAGFRVRPGEIHVHITSPVQTGDEAITRAQVAALCRDQIQQVLTL